MPDSLPDSGAPSAVSAARAWLASEFSQRLAQVFESLTQQSPRIEPEDLQEAPSEPGLSWRQTFSGIPGAVWLLADEPAWTALGRQVLRAAGIGESDPQTARSTYLETIGQALAGVAQSLAGRLHREVSAPGGAEAPPPAGGIEWIALRIGLAGETAVLTAGFDADFAGALAEAPADGEGALERRSPGARGVTPPPGSKTFELLLDVELPVSVSFGRAQVPLKDVLKLTTGSIVELNRSITEPVEIIVNNCVIARGEVVVVEGNFGVRIQQVVSRQERLRTLS